MRGVPVPRVYYAIKSMQIPGQGLSGGCHPVRGAHSPSCCLCRMAGPLVGPIARPVVGLFLNKGIIALVEFEFMLLNFTTMTLQSCIHRSTFVTSLFVISSGSRSYVDALYDGIILNSCLSPKKMEVFLRPTISWAICSTRPIVRKISFFFTTVQNYDS